MRRVNVDFPVWVVSGPDRHAKNLDVTRQALTRLSSGLLSCSTDKASLADERPASLIGAESPLDCCRSLAHFEWRLIVERTRDGVAAARDRGKKLGRPNLDDDNFASALKLVAVRVSTAEAVKQLGIGRSTIYREMRRLGIKRPA